MTADEKFMTMALRLAPKGFGSIEPNPAVGAVIVRDGRVIGRGWHRRFGGPHAEINAIEDCRKCGGNPQGATMYVNLEPCCHYGKTGPCTDAIIAAKISRVVAAMMDPSEQVNGGGLIRLQEAGVAVEVGIREQQARLLNAPFIKFARSGRAWITLKWAQSLDCKLAYASVSARRRWISAEPARRDAHNLRRRAGAILVGINTVLADDPLLTPRPAGGSRPIRVVLDNRLRIPIGSQLLTTAEDVPAVIVASEKAVLGNLDRVKEIKNRAAEVLACPAGRSSAQFIVDQLSNRGVSHLLVEGGPTVISSFLTENLADEIVVYVASKMLGEEGRADIAGAVKGLPGGVNLSYVDVRRFGDDVRISGLTESGLRWSGLKKE